MEQQPHTFGHPTRDREVAGAAVLLAGALAVAVMAALGQPPHRGNCYAVEVAGGGAGPNLLE